MDLHGLTSAAYSVPVSRLVANPMDYTKDDSDTLVPIKDPAVPAARLCS